MAPEQRADRRIRIAIYILAIVIGCLLNSLYPAERLWGIAS